MLNTHKLLYILPDLAYVAELLPAKKPNTFAVQTFRQINGEFMDDNEFIAKNVLKLFSKLEAEEYHLILPDFLFTNTIVSVKETGDTKVKKYLKEELLPSLSLTTESHEIETFILTEFKGESKVQLSAIEKSVLAPIRVGAQQAQVKIKAVSPLSWAIKSVVSLEPSISVLQIGQTLYCALQYIGVDQTMQAPVSEIEAIAETIKTLKGGEPNIQTIYLLSNSLVEQRLKELASDTIPIQQLNSLREDDAQMPSYVKDIIEYSMRTLSVSDYPVPAFTLGKVTPADLSLTDNSSTEPTADSKAEHKEEPDEQPTSAHSAQEEVPAPERTQENQDAEHAEEDEPSSDTMEDEEKESAVDDAVKVQAEFLEITTITTTQSEVATADSPDTHDLEDQSDTTDSPEDDIETVDLSRFAAHSTTVASTSISETKTSHDERASSLADEVAQLDEEDDRETDASEPSSVVSGTTSSATRSAAITSTSHLPVVTKPKSVIKHSSGVGPMLKMVFITLVVFAITVAVGIGVGLGLLQLNNKNNADTSPVVVTSPSPTPVAASPSPSPKAEVDKTAVSILVVNATTKAGYAGTIKDLLTKDGFTQVTAGNAKGTAYKGNSLLLDEENSSLVDAVQTAADLDELVGYASDSAHPKATEDASSKYDAVLVLSE